MPSDRPRPIDVFAADRLAVQVFATREEMGLAAGLDAIEQIAALSRRAEFVRMIFAAAPSQNEFLATLAASREADWGRVHAFHMDEYVGLAPGAPQRFGTFLRDRLFGKVALANVEYLDGSASDALAECERYAELLSRAPIDIVCAGVGENGHMAFNDPHVADFGDAAAVKPVTLDQTCRLQQVHDGAFPDLDAVPKQALTLTMPTLMSAQWLYCMVPGKTKAEAVRRTILGSISTECPATIMKRHAHATLYLDRESAALLDRI